MQSEDDFDDILLALYQSKTDEKMQATINKYLVRVLEALSSPEKKISDQAVKTVNEILTFIKPKPFITVPLREIVISFLKSKKPLMRNISAIFIKMGLERSAPCENSQIARTLMIAFKTLPQPLQISTYKTFILAYNFIQPQQYIEQLSKQILLVKVSLKSDLKSFSFIPEYMQTNLSFFKNHEELFALFMIHFEHKNIDTPADFDSTILLKTYTEYYTKAGNDMKIKSKCLKYMSGLNIKISLDFVFNALSMNEGLELLDKQISLNESMDPFTHKFAEELVPKMENELAIRCLRSLLKKFHAEFQNDSLLFKDIFSSSAEGESYTSLIYLFSSFIEPSCITKFLEGHLIDGNTKRALPLLRYIYPFAYPRPRLFACALASDPEMSDECRLLLHPYKHNIIDGFRQNIFDQKAPAPTTTELFSELLNMPELKKYLSNANNSRSISSLFSFACRCKATLPIPFTFIISEFSQSPSSAPEISKFLVFISQQIDVNVNLSEEDINECINVMKEESDPDIIEAISRFLFWSKAKINIEEIAQELKFTKKIGFLAHFGCPFDECFDLLNSATQNSFAKHCLMALAQRNLLNKEHFDKLFDKLHIDSFGIEILSCIAKGDKELCRRIVQCLFEPPLISTDRIEVIVAGAKKMVSVIDEEFLMKHIDDGLRKDRSRRNSAIFLVYMISSKVPERLWFSTRSLMFCAGAENGVVRTAGILGLPALYNICNDEEKKIFDDAIHGRNKPENSDVHAQLPSGQPRAQIISTVLRLSGNNSNLFCQLLTSLIEPEFLIFSNVSVPEANVEQQKKDELSSFFYYESFSPKEERSTAFRRLYRWATDGGKKLLVADVIAAVDPEADGWDAQQTNISCLRDIVARMSSEQAHEFFGNLTKVALRIAYGPVKELQIAAAEVLDKMVTKIGHEAPKATLQAVLDLINASYDSHNTTLVLFATKWCGELAQQMKTGEESLIVFDALFRAISSACAFPSVAEMLSGDAWTVFTRAIFKCAELSLNKFFDKILTLLNQSFALDSVRYSVYYSLDAIVRSPERLKIAERIENELPRLMLLATNEKSESVLPIVVSCLQHSISAVSMAHDDSYDYDHFIIELFFEKERADLSALLIKAICVNSPEYFRPSLSPFVLFASCGDVQQKEFSTVLRDEIALRIEVNSNPMEFVKFAMNYGVIGGSLAQKPAGAKALKKAFSQMKSDTLSKMGAVIEEVAQTLDGRLYPSKEDLIEVITLAIPHLPTIPSPLATIMVKQCTRQKSVFRAAAANCVRALKAKGIAVDEKLFGESLISMAKEGAGVALETSADLAEGQYVQLVANEVYKRIDKADSELVPNLICAIQNLKEHTPPEWFDMDDLEAKLV